MTLSYRPADEAPLRLPPAGDLTALRSATRRFVEKELATGGFRPQVDSWMSGFDRDFSRRAAAAGFVGMTVPTEYGGQGRTYLERFVVTEELLAAGAPVAAHWFADRQIAPGLLKHGTDAQKNRYLPAIAAGELAFSIGMSEPEAGSDLAAVATRGRRTRGGWHVSGRKVWTSHAHRADFLLALVRTDPKSRRHDGLSQVLVDLRAPGVNISPIVSLNGRHDFNEVVLDDVFIPDHQVLGVVGEGWQQVIAELGYERSGPERFLSVQPVLELCADAVRAGDFAPTPALGRNLARVIALHHASAQVAVKLSSGESADFESSVVKLLGTMTEGDVLEDLAYALNAGEHSASLRDTLDEALLARPGFTLRGGTNEILRGIVARILGLR